MRTSSGDIHFHHRHHCRHLHLLVNEHHLATPFDANLSQRLLLLPLAPPSSFSSITSTREWSEYISSSAELQLVNVSQLSPLEKTCFFLNVYHIMVLHGLIDRGHEEGCDMKDKWLQFARSVKYMVGAFNYSMESIEDSLKQAALAGASGGWMTGASMRPAGVLMLCINRMIVGSPQLQVFLPSLWESQLTAVCRDVCARVHVNNSAKTVTLPKVFEAHRDLFPKDHQDFLVAISMYCPADVQCALVGNLSFKVKYHREDWRVAFPCHSQSQGASASAAREPVLGRKIDAQIAQIPHATQPQLMPPARAGNDHLFTPQQEQYALEYRGDLQFHLPPAPMLAPPNLTSIGLPALAAPAR
jgi:hypothetical protein